ncbi:MAG: hypothetical protein AVDCRST_MAG05-918 [uncultured Rubrobacteraceae bacterium]|uniref:Uncharacterized protein n=1 Tax=uncultured Rubrobacteraceae bacterium TaxID=349277 RepID=A0A6J4RRR3_9ACTN|nr:MAG: hypothetical protein AVDCRST_MAG05-918 [uncultured Rubrobacteraceae bacterium]
MLETLLGCPKSLLGKGHRIRRSVRHGRYIIEGVSRSGVKG